MIIREMKQTIDGKLYYIIIAMIDGAKQKTQAQITDSQDTARAECVNNLGIIE